MPLSRPNQTRPPLTLDEQAFQGLLSAAFTIQEHNDRRHRDQEQTPEAENLSKPEDPPKPEPVSSCPRCGAHKPDEASSCGTCGVEELRPGERLQRNWASMWLMSQEQGLWPERFSEHGEGLQRTGADPRKDVAPIQARDASGVRKENPLIASNFPAFSIANQNPGETVTQESGGAPHDQVSNQSMLDRPHLTLDQHVFHNSNESNWDTDTPDIDAGEITAAEPEPFSEAQNEETHLTVPPFELSADAEPHTPETADDPTNASTTVPGSMLQRLAELEVTLRFHRADLYLGLAVFVALLALLWPTASAPRRAALSPWERALVTLGIAEAPAPAIHVQGDPSIEVWIDPHTALYYCPGAEPYGKTADGRFSSQREAQLDRFEPAGRSACE